MKSVFKLFILLYPILCCKCSSRNEVVAKKDYYPSGKIRSIVHFKGDKKFGTSISYFEDGVVSSRAFLVDDKFKGKLQFFYPTGKKMREQAFDDEGKPAGKYTSWYGDGTLMQEGAYLNGKMTGRWISYYSNTKVKVVEFYTDNLKDSIWVYYDEDGSELKEERYKEDKLIASRSLK